MDATSAASLGGVQWCASPTRSSLSDSSPVCITCSSGQLERVVRTRLQSLGSDWGVGPCQLISADSIYDDFLTPAALWHALHSRMPHGPAVAWSVLGRIHSARFSQVNFVCAKWSFDPWTVRICGCFPSSGRVRSKNCGSMVDRCPHNTGGVPLSLYCCRCRPLKIRKPNRNRNRGF